MACFNVMATGKAMVRHTQECTARMEELLERDIETQARVSAYKARRGYIPAEPERQEGDSADAAGDPQGQPGGGPQGSLLGGFLFLILINLCGFPEQDYNLGGNNCIPRGKFVPQTLHTKYVDDMTLLESINLKKSLILDPAENE